MRINIREIHPVGEKSYELEFDLPGLHGYESEKTIATVQFAEGLRTVAMDPDFLCSGRIVNCHASDIHEFVKPIVDYHLSRQQTPD